MKKRISTYIYIMFSVLLCSCTESQFYGEEVSSLSPGYLNVLCESPNNTITFPAIPKDKSFSVISTNTPWSITNSALWIKTNMMSGGETSAKEEVSEVNLTLEENKQADTLRSCVLFVNSLKEDYPIKKAITIVQNAATPFIEPECTYKILSGGKDTYRIHVESNFHWQPTSDASWITLVREGDDLYITTEENPTVNVKTATIILQGMTTATIQIEQEPAGVRTLTDTLYFDNVAATYNLRIDADMSWTATTAQSWILVSPINGERDNGNLTVSVTPNNSTETREGSVYITVGAQNIRIPIIQKGYFLEIDKNNVEIGSHGGTIQIDLFTNEKWNAQYNKEEWFTVHPSYGEKNSTLWIEFKDNPFLSSRMTEIIFSTDYIRNVALVVLQNARYLKTSVNSVGFFDKGGISEPIKILSDAEYSWYQEGDWFSTTIENNIITVVASENNTETWRHGKLIFRITDLKEGEMTLTIPVDQSIKGQKIDKEDFPNDENWTDNDQFEKTTVTIIDYKDDEDWTNK